MVDEVKALTLGSRPIHGHVTFELFDAKTRDLVQKVEKDNLVTSALSRLLNNVAGGAESYLDDLVMPVATKALGGLMLFDDRLTEDVDNIQFPANANLVGYGLRDVNTSDVKRGSLNSAESGRISNGYRSVWDFGTSQANGNIAAAALMNSYVTPFRGCANLAVHDIINASGNSNYDAGVFHTDGEYVYYATGTGSYTSERDLDTRIYTYTHTITVRIYKERVPLTSYKVADSVNYRSYPELVTTRTFSIVTQGYTLQNYNAPTAVVCDGKDGYAYFIYCAGNTEGNAEIYYYTIKYDDLSFSASAVTTLTPAGIYLKAGNGVVSGGYMYLISNNRHGIYKIPLSNPANAQLITLPEGFYITNTGNAHYATTPNPAGGLMLLIYRAAANDQSGYYDMHSAILSASGTITVEGDYYSRNNSATYAPGKGFYRNYDYMQSWIWLSGSWANYPHYGRALTNYLGTIANLPTPVVKNASQTLKVTYTLTDA